ncbi:cell division protein FtsQ [Desulfonispora thiosulfatigenes DSM 11270]|uniref:Cell division protein FtsQ n=1 Tax=Desulfonispora thiosulfatigenes DSM 11270 TaxID=656914 RepID=A0A1W1VSS0_DESTI|nr:FtsQ-type POTRA domain-containing protein [Desulfonispora thiosulfatigenes]SMB96417.1 cell division protein FtsQ [Desulfonispora thiosulfatigenes DSM 11270]
MKNELNHVEKSKGNKKKVKSFKVVYFFLFIIGIYFFLHSPIFNIQNVEVIGNKNLTKQQVIKLSQVNQGDNLFKIEKNDIIKNISIHPLIESVEISRDLPSTLKINVLERKPIGLVVCEDGFIQVSEKGVFISINNDLGSYQLPVISGVSMDYLPGPGQIIKNEGLHTALEILTNIESDLLINIAEINVADPRYILAYTTQGIEIRLGSKKEVQSKLENLQDILEKIINLVIDEKAIEYIDLRFSGPPIIKKK